MSATRASPHQSNTAAMSASLRGRAMLSHVQRTSVQGAGGQVETELAVVLAVLAAAVGVAAAIIVFQRKAAARVPLLEREIERRAEEAAELRAQLAAAREKLEQT